MKKFWKNLPVMALSLILAAVFCSSALAGAFGGGPYEEPDGSGIPKDDPVSTTGTLYGYSGSFDIDSAASEQVSISEGVREINNEQRIFWGGPVIQNIGRAVLTVRDSYIRGETSVETLPWPEVSKDLLTAGNIRAVLALGSGYNYYINSSIVSRNLAAISSEEADQFMTPERRELNLYTYGSEAVAMEGGYGIYSDLFCNLYSYGSHVQAAETGVISGTYGNIVIGTIADGEKNPAVDLILNDQDRAKRADKESGSVIEGGRNALMIHSRNLPQYWEYEGYSKELLPWYHTNVTAHKSILRTDTNLDHKVKYNPEEQAFIDHTAGSVILIKSTNAEINLDECEIIPDENGTGCLVQTVINNDISYMNAVPDGENYPGIMMNMRSMNVKGDISHEDYQRDFYLTLENTALDGSLNEYNCAHWNKSALEEGFAGFCPDTSYSTHHGLNVSILSGSVWNVTGESHLSRLYTDKDCQVNGIIILNGVEQNNQPGNVYEGNVVVMPLKSGISTESKTSEPAGQPVPQVPTEPAKEPGTPVATEPAKEPETPAPTEPAKEPETPAPTEHVHEWIIYTENPANCTLNGIRIWICNTCGEEYKETLPALGHDWYLDYELPASCTIDGSRNYRCSRCGEFYSEPSGEKAYGHKMSSTPIITVYATCDTDGECIYQCENCLAIVKTEVIPATGHSWHLDSIVPATCTTEGSEYWSCANCGKADVVISPAFGHDYQITSHVDSTCDSQGQDVYTCTNCGDVYYNDLPVLGHNWVFQYNVPASCLISGYDVYQCSNCGAEDWLNLIPASGHNYMIYPTPGNESMTHTYECTACSDSYTEIHTSIGIGSCPVCGYAGPFG